MLVLEHDFVVALEAALPVASEHDAVAVAVVVDVLSAVRWSDLSCEHLVAKREVLGEIVGVV